MCFCMCGNHYVSKLYGYFFFAISPPLLAPPFTLLMQSCCICENSSENQSDLFYYTSCLSFSLSLSEPPTSRPIYSEKQLRSKWVCWTSLYLLLLFQITQFFFFFIFERKCRGPLVLVLFSVLIYFFYLFSLVFLILFSCILLTFYFFPFFISIKS